MFDDEGAIIPRHHDRTRALGLVTSGERSALFAETVDGMRDAAADAGYVVVPYDADRLGDDTAPPSDPVAPARPDGLLLHGGYGAGADRLLPLRHRLPAVFVDVAGPPDTASVRLPDEAASRLATEHLVRLGHERVTFVSGPSSSSFERGRSAFSDVLRRHRLPRRASVLSAGWSAGAAHDAVLSHLTRPGRGPRPTGYVAADTTVAAGVLSALASAGLDLPAEASVVACHDTWLAPHLSPSLSTVRLPLRELGAAAVRALLDTIDDRPTGEILITDPEPELMIRASTIPPKG